MHLSQTSSLLLLLLAENYTAVVLVLKLFSNTSRMLRSRSLFLIINAGNVLWNAVLKHYAIKNYEWLEGSILINVGNTPPPPLLKRENDFSFLFINTEKFHVIICSEKLIMRLSLENKQLCRLFLAEFFFNYFNQKRLSSSYSTRRLEFKISCGRH